MRRRNKSIIKTILIMIAIILAFGAGYFIVDYLIPAESIAASAEEPATRKVNFYNNYEEVYQTEEVEAQLLSTFVEANGHTFYPNEWEDDEELFYFTFNEAEHRERHNAPIDLIHDFTFSFEYSKDFIIYILDEDREYTFEFYFDEMPYEKNQYTITFVQLDEAGKEFTIAHESYDEDAQIVYPDLNPRSRGIFTMLGWSPKPQTVTENAVITLNYNVASAYKGDRTITTFANGTEIEAATSIFGKLTDFLTEKGLDINASYIPQIYKNITGYFYIPPKAPGIEGYKYNGADYSILSNPLFYINEQPLFLLTEANDITVHYNYSEITDQEPEPEPQPTPSIMSTITLFFKENPIAVSLIVGFLLLLFIGIVL